MRTLRGTCRLCLGFLAALTGCGNHPEPPAQEQEQGQLEVVQVTTLTTVQASSGLFLSPSAEREVPDYVVPGEAVTPIAPTDGLDRAKVDLTVLFRDGGAASVRQLDADLSATGAGEWSPVGSFFPTLEATPSGAHWPLELGPADDVVAAISSEWSGWQAFGGLGVRAPHSANAATAAFATLGFELRGQSSPLILSLESSTLTLTNQSNRTIERALLIYSHPGGIGVTAVNALGPGASSVTTLGPKEHPPETLLAMARADLRAFFAASLGEELGAAMADAKSIPFLETQGLRLISLLDATDAPTRLDFSRPPASQKQVVVSHSEIFKPEEEQRMVGVVADETLEPSQVQGELGRFTEAKLEYVSVSADAAVSARANSLLEQLRAQ